MPTLNSEAQAIIAAFENQPGVTPAQAQNLRASIGASAALIEQINAAVDKGHLKQIEPLSHAHAGGEYDRATKSMRLPLDILTVPQPGRPFNTGEVVFTLGHELQHGFSHVATMQAYATFQKEAMQAARTHHDYTAAIGHLIAANRRDEASAEIAGWNAIVSMVKATNPEPSLTNIFEAHPHRMRDFFDKSDTSPPVFALKPGLTPNADLTLSPTPANLEAMGQNFFDKIPDEMRLGALGNSDYINYYGAWAISEAAKLEHHYSRTPSITVNLSRLRLNEQLLEENGIDLGGARTSMPYYDSSTVPPARGLFQHTITTHEHVMPISARAYEAERSRDPDLALPWQREHALHDARPSIDKSSSIDALFEALYHAAVHKDDALARQVGQVYAQSDAGQLFFEQGRFFNQQQQLQEQQIELERRQCAMEAPVRTGPVLSLFR